MNASSKRTSLNTDRVSWNSDSVSPGKATITSVESAMSRDGVPNHPDLLQELRHRVAAEHSLQRPIVPGLKRQVELLAHGPFPGHDFHQFGESRHWDVER